MQHKNLCTET